MSDLERDVLRAVQVAIAEAIQKNLTGYNTPLNKLIDSVINTHTGELRDIIESSFSKTILSEDFKVAVNNAFTHKLARILVDKLEGAIEKRVNDLRSDPTMKAKMILAIEGVLTKVPHA